LRTGVIVGALSFPDKQTNAASLPLYHDLVKLALHEATGSPAPKLPSRPTVSLTNASDTAAHVTRALGLGPCSLSLDAACASSLYAIRLACDYLASHRSDVMLAAAVSGADPLFVHMGFSIFQAYPQNGLSAPFSPGSQGLFAGEGAAVLVIKRLADAQAHGDRILGVIQGVGLSNDGRGQFVLSPNPKGQQAAFERAWQTASGKGLTPGQLQVIECHATGTPLGDKVELASMEHFFSELRSGELPLIGSAKGNVGHLLTAAGMVGMVKTLQAMAHGIVPASPGLEQAALPHNTAFARKIVTQPQPWPATSADGTKHNRSGTQNTIVDNNKVAAVSAFGFGGCNAHLVLSQHPVEPNPAGSGSLKLDESISNSSARPPFTEARLLITGLAAHIGKLDSLSALAGTLSRQQPALQPFPPKRWKGLQALLPHGQAPLGGYIEQFELDLMKFKLPATEQDRLIPQQLLLLKQADEAIRDAGLTAGSKTAVVVAMETEPELHQFRGRVELHTLLPQYLSTLGITLTADEYATLEPLVMDAVLGKAQLNQYTSFIGNIMASRVAALWDFSGPAFTVSAGEQGFARGIEIAGQLLNAKDADAVVLCAVDLAGSAEHALLSPTELPLADGAAAMVLTLASEPLAESRAQTGYGTLHMPVFGRQASANRQTPTQEQEQTRALAEIVDKLLSACGALPQLQVISGQGEALPSLASHHPAQLIGYPGAASGLFATLTAMMNDTGSALITALQGDIQSALLLEQAPSQRQALKERLQQPVPATQGPSLPKIITLGGDDIAASVRSAVTEAGLSHKACTDAQEQVVNQAEVQQVTQTHPAINDTGLETRQTLAANQRQLADAHIAFLNARQAGLKQANTLLRQQLA
ncbi:MAG: 3-hydroxyacyl-[acyl-carrier-protein] dehydratase FabA, partial [Shewanella sp.]|nr:3-hydroxyacyl-[acyl-carrier-protein] dehydratase FabA [Shewanella sp.]